MIHCFYWGYWHQRADWRFGDLPLRFIQEEPYMINDKYGRPQGYFLEVRLLACLLACIVELLLRRLSLNYIHCLKLPWHDIVYLC